LNINVICKSLEEVETPALVFTIFENETDGIEKFDSLNPGLSNKLTKLINLKEVTGKYKEFTMVHADGFKAERILIMGLGKRKDFTIDRFMAGIAIAARNIRRINLSEMTVAKGFQEFPVSSEKIGCAIIEGIVLGLYRFRKHMSGDQNDFKAIKNLTIIVKDENSVEEVKKGALKGFSLAESTNFVRDLVNEPANLMTPEVFAQEAKQMAKEHNLKINVLEMDELKKENMHALLAVNSGSREPARLVAIEYDCGNPSAKTIGLVGKGVTFDSGGLSLKPAEAMFRMHYDMAGAASVLGAIRCIAEQKLPVNVVGVMPLTENLVDSNSYKVGDVIKTRGGKSVEILNTDAEGRLILADGLSYIQDLKKLDFLVDIATLTGAVVMALGHFCSGAMTNDDKFYKVVEAAGEVAGEKVWQLPLFDEYLSQIKSDVADLENSGGRPAGSITAAIFLKQFVGDVPWVHLDIAGTAWNESVMTYVKNPYLPKEGATGIGTRLLYYIAELISKS
jgi:leucyl aminopeptidase